MDRNSDFSFMKTGFSQDISNSTSEEDILNIGSVFVVLVQNATEIGGTYSLHAGRKTITAIDAKKSLKLEVMIFSKRDDTLGRAKDIVQDYKDNKHYYDNSDTEEDEEDEEEEFTVSECSCFLCDTINNIEEKWSNWVPNSDLEIMLKNNTDKL